MARSDSASLIAKVRELVARETGLAVVVTYRPDGLAHASVVNAGIIEHPVSGELAVGFVVQGGARKKLANLRARPKATVVFRSGWEWVAIDGDVDLIGPDDRGCVEPDSTPHVFHEIYAAALGGAPHEWAAQDEAIERERHTAVLVRPSGMHSSET